MYQKLEFVTIRLVYVFREILGIKQLRSRYIGLKYLEKFDHGDRWSLRQKKHHIIDYPLIHCSSCLTISAKAQRDAYGTARYELTISTKKREGVDETVSFISFCCNT